MFVSIAARLQVVFTQTFVHLNFSWPEIKSTCVNLKYIISIHSKTIEPCSGCMLLFSEYVTLQVIASESGFLFVFYRYYFHV